MEKRNYGIDLLRIISMLMVCILHILNKGLLSAEIFSANYEIAWLIQFFSLCAVNVYALISGYVGINSSHRYSGIIMLWLQAAFYTVAIYVIKCFISPETFGIKSLIHAVLPVTFSNYWYLTAYFCLFFLTPALNFLVLNMPLKRLRGMIISCLFLFSVMPTFSMKDMFHLKFGYGFVWISFLYLLGAYFKKYDVIKNIKPKKAIFVYVIAVMISWGFKLLTELITTRFLGKAVYGNMFIHYVSPTIIISAVMLLAVFSKIEVGKQAEKAIKFLTPLVFGVYLIHENEYVRPLIETFVKNFAALSPAIFPFAVLGTAVLIYFVCTFIEFLRFSLFRLLRVKKLALKIDRFSEERA